MAVRHYLKCPVCGASGQRSAFVRGAAFGYSPQHLIQLFHGRQIGGHGGVEWRRHAVSVSELEIVGAAVARAANTIADRMPEALDAPSDDAAGLASVEDDAEAELLGQQWVDEAEAEADRRRKILADDLAQRQLAQKRRRVW